MGVSIANKAASLGANVILILGPSHQKVFHNNINVIFNPSDNLHNPVNIHIYMAILSLSSLSEYGSFITKIQEPEYWNDNYLNYLEFLQ